MENQIQVVFADSSSYFRRGLRADLSKFNTIRIVAEASDGDELLDTIAKTACDVVMLDLELPKTDGMTAIPLIKEKFPKVRIIVLSPYEDDKSIIHAVAAGVNSYLHKNIEPKDLAEAIAKVVKEGIYFSATVARVLQANLPKKGFADSKLSHKIHFGDNELEVIKWLCKGLSNEEIGKRMIKKERTIEGYRLKIMTKMGVHNLQGLMTWALKNNIVDKDGDLI